MSAYHTLQRIVGSETYNFPEPTKVSETYETIWASNAGRNDDGEMKGDCKAEKITLAIEWGNLTQAELNGIKSHMPKGFFTLKYVGTSITGYRSEISAEVAGIDNGVKRYSSASVQFIEK